MPLPPFQASSVAALTDPVELAPVLGSPIRAVRTEPLHGIGYSNAALSRVELTRPEGDPLGLVLKHVRLGEDWIALRTCDVTGRETLPLREPSLAPVWEMLACPYVAFACEPGHVGLLMHDLGSSLLPDVREPLTEAQESALLGTLARLHARFWDAGTSAIAGLMSPARYCDLVAPDVTRDDVGMAAMPAALRDSIIRGWEVAMGRLPPAIADQFIRPGAELEEAWADLPQTLLHGDTKVANCAVLPDSRVSMFDWALVGSGPCALDLGWYLAVNGSRLTASKEEVIARYRAQLESALGGALPGALWRRLEDVAVLSGARMLLWSKAFGLDVGRAGAEAEWTWWVERLAAI